MSFADLSLDPTPEGSFKITAMSRIRLLVAWLIMAALPVQGFAAATMLFCGMERGAVVSQSTTGPAHQGHSHHGTTFAGHDHAAHGHGAAHGEDSPGKTDPAKVHQDKPGHTCAVCASCCQVVALGGFTPFAQAGDAPGVEPAQPIVRIVTRATSLPDKPPRA